MKKSKAQVAVKSKQKGKGNATVEDDPRFQDVFSDAKFRRIPKMERKVKVDSRFEGMFNEPRFKTTYKRDKRGRAISKTSTEDMKKFYELGEEEESAGKEPESKNTKEDEQIDDEEDEESSDEESEDKMREDLKIKLDLARGEGNLESSSSSDDDDEEEEEWEVAGEEDQEEGLVQDFWGEIDRDAPIVEEATSRLAVCNMNWDRMKAKDILVLLSSFKPADGRIQSVAIYPSEFGKERMEAEKLNGPAELRGEQNVEEDDPEEPLDEKEQEEEQRKLTEKIRQYQLQRLKYYYAVVVCDSSETANAIYEGCNGVEYETSGERVDLRFIPEDMRFDEEPSDKATEIGDLSAYEPKQFVDSALQMTSAELTWDETDPERLRKTRKIFDQDLEKIQDADLDKILASSSDDEPEEVKLKYNDIFGKLLTGSEKSNMFGKVRDETDSDDEQPKEESVREKKKVWRKSQQKVAKQNDQSLDLLISETDKGKKHFNMAKLVEKDKKGKKKKKESEKEAKEDNFKIDTADPRFAAVYESHLYNIDPSDAGFKKTAGMKSILEKKAQVSKKRKLQPDSALEEAKETKRTPKDETAGALATSLKEKVAKLSSNKKKKVRGK